VDGYLLPASVREIFARGEQAPVPLLAGWNQNEGDPRWYLGGQAVTLENYKRALGVLGEHMDEVLQAYDIRSDADVLSRGAVDLTSDLFTGYPTWKWCEAHRASGYPVYRYKFIPARPAMAVAGKKAGLAGGVTDASEDAAPEPEIPEGAVHSADIEYAMGNLATNTVYAWREEDYRLSELFTDYYAAFVKTGNPNQEGLPLWPLLDDSAEVMQLDFEPKVLARPEVEARYRLLDAIMTASSNR